jgi:hypothetical protein
MCLFGYLHLRLGLRVGKGFGIKNQISDLYDLQTHPLKRVHHATIQDK